MTEAEHRLHRTGGCMLYHPLQILRLQVGNAHMLHYPFFAQRHQGRECLIDNLLQSTFTVGLELHIVHINQVDIVDVQTFHTLIHAVGNPLCRVVPEIHAVVSAFR